MKDEMIELTKQMVAVASVNGTSGEKDIGVFIEKYLRAIPYFTKNQGQVIVQELAGDSLNRRNVFALVRGQKDDNPKTVILHGHTDTVGVEDYGALKDYAFDCDRLMQELSKVELPREVREDLESGDYLFGRGACDMKSGDAVFMVMMKHIAEHVEELSGNILLSCNPVEENLHTGIIQGADVLLELKEKYNLEYTLAINNDYTCPMYPGDEHQYIYTGVGGKILPCFYIQGRETHVGQCFEGFDPTSVAGRLASLINLNPDFCDVYKGEYSLPPVALKMKDLKPWYNVQTAKEALVYFNYFVLNEGMDSIIGKLKAAAVQIVNETYEDMNEKYKKFCELTGKEFTAISNDCDVITYEELLERAIKGNDSSVINAELLGRAIKKNDSSVTNAELDSVTCECIEKGVDAREIPVELIRYLLAKAGIYHPVVVLYIGAPYCPHNTLQDEDESTIAKLEKIVHEVEQEENEVFNICRFFPSLSDSSYLRIDDSDESVECLENNFPQMHQLYPVPIDKIRKLNIKAVDFGVHGKDAHKWTERLYVPYSFGVLPKLIEKALREFL